jgi:hypothetical protein
MKGATLHLLPPSKLREGPHGLLLVQGLVTADGSHKKKNIRDIGLGHQWGNKTMVFCDGH